MLCRELTMNLLLKPNYHQKKWLKYKPKLRLKPMQHHKPKQQFRLLTQLESSQLLRKHRLKPKLKQRQTPNKPQLLAKSATPRLNSSPKIKPLLQQMPQLLPKQQNHIQVPKSNYPRMKLLITQRLSQLPLMPCSKKKNHGRK